MRRILALIFILVMTVSAFAGCSKSDGDTASGNAGSTASAPGTTVVISTDDVTFLDENGESRYCVVRPDNEEMTPMASMVFLGVKKGLNVNVKNVLDVNQDGNDAYEILVGNTNRPESAQALALLKEQTSGRYKDYIICTIGKKIVINGFTTEAINDACVEFVNNVFKAEGIKGGLNITYETVGNFSDYTINGTAIGMFSFIRPHYNSSYLTQMEMEKMQDSVLQAAGYYIDIKEDMYVEPGQFEILVGNNNREGIPTTSNYDEYFVTIKGDKVYLNGGSPHATAVAVTEFTNLITTKGAVTDADSFSGSYAATVMNYDRTTYYTHVWGDDFDGTEVDTTKWDVITEEHYGKGADGLSGQNGKQALRVPEANVVKDGFLYQLQYYDDKAYYGGTIRTNKHMKFLGGYLEHSMIHPDNPSSWNTCWMSSVEGNGYIGPEIDLNENFGNPNVTDANAHVWPTAAGTAEYGWEHRSFDTIRANESKFTLPVEDQAEHNLNTELHTFGFLWTQDYIAFTGDGKIYCDLNLNDEGFEDYKMAFTTVAVKVIIAASPGVGTGPKDTSTEEHWESSKSDYITDYIHIYQVSDGWSRIEFDY